MNPYLQVAGLEPRTLAGLLGVNAKAFEAWAADQRTLPESLIDRVAAVLGVNPEHLYRRPRQPVSEESVRPSVWFRFRGKGLTEADRELVVLIRELALRMNELDETLERESIRWMPIFSGVSARVDTSAAPREQGRSAARAFRSLSGFDHGQQGVGELIRPWMRSMGILVVEVALPESKLAGCAFYVGDGDAARPVVFANLAGSTWFRRNTVLIHELAHAIFDAKSEGATLDFGEPAANPALVPEERADAFAQEVLVPKQVLRHIAAQSGTTWEEFAEGDLAQFVADTQVEQGLVLRALGEAGLVAPGCLANLEGLNIAKRLKELTDRALSTDEFFEKYPGKQAEISGKRTTTLRSRKIRLPVAYVDDVWQAWNDREISDGRAAEMLMIARDEFLSRFDASRPLTDEL